MTASVINRRNDYLAPKYTIEKTDLIFVLSPEKTIVKSRLLVKRINHDEKIIELDGEGLDLRSVSIDGKALKTVQDYVLDDKSLKINADFPQFTLEIENSINPSENTSLEGLYFVKGAFCTQCEAEGFRKITYYLDRPDVLSVFTVEIKADPDKYPYLLSNGNLIEDSNSQGERTVKWHDPHPKPSYLLHWSLAILICLKMNM